MTDTLNTENQIVTEDTEQDVAPVADVAAEPTEPAEPTEGTPAQRDGREAAKYRRQLRDTEAERDALRSQLDAMRRAEVDSILVGERRPAKAAIIYAAGIDTAELLAEDGTVDRTLVLAALDRAGATLGVDVRLPAAPSSHGQGRMGDDVGYSVQPQFSDAFAPRR